MNENCTEFLEYVRSFKGAILAQENLLIPALELDEEILPRKHPDKKAQDERIINFEKENAKKLLEILQPISESAFIYGKQFQDDCYYGQGENVNRLLNKKGSVWHFNLKEDLWSGCENFWINNDNHETVPRWHATGDIYFVLPIHSIDWKSFFTKILCWGALSKLKSTVVSQAGYKQVSSLIEERDDVVAVEFSQRVIRTSSKNLERLALIAAAYNEPPVENLDKSCEEIIFGSKENAKLALDFSNDEYPLNELLK